MPRKAAAPVESSPLAASILPDLPPPSKKKKDKAAKKEKKKSKEAKPAPTEPETRISQPTEPELAQRSEQQQQDVVTLPTTDAAFHDWYLAKVADCFESEIEDLNAADAPVGPKVLLQALESNLVLFPEAERRAALAGAGIAFKNTS